MLKTIYFLSVILYAICLFTLSKLTKEYLKENDLTVKEDTAPKFIRWLSVLGMILCPVFNTLMCLIIIFKWDTFYEQYIESVENQCE